VLKGHVHVRFEAQMDEPWDLKEVLRNHKDPWRSSFKTAFPFGDFEVTDGNWTAVQDANQEQVDCADRMDGWDLLLATA
jgi:hypothetical protein